MNITQSGSGFISVITNSFKNPRFYILFLFAIIYSLISLVNHYNYHTSAFDLGIYNNCLYQYGHFHKNHYPYLHHMFTNFLSDHFSLYTVILSPLHYIFGSYTLLYVQIASVLVGAFGIYKIVKEKYDRPFLAEIAMIHYLSFFAIYSALSFDYHDNVVSAMLVPWFIYYFNKGNVKRTILFAVLIVIGKENMPLWLSFICIGLFFLNRKDKSKRMLAVIISVSAVVYAIIVIKLIMPNMGEIKHAQGYYHFKYTILGNSASELISNLIHHPVKIIKALYFSHIIGPELRGIKFELYKCLALSGGILLFLRPSYLIMLVPIIAQKVFSDDFGKWGINVHYCIEFAPIVVIGFYDSISRFKNPKLILALSSVFCVLTIYATFSKMEKRESLYYNRLTGDPFYDQHYKTEFNRKEVKRVMALIPDDANLSALTHFAPHLSMRKNIYQFPDVHDAEYIMIARAEMPYPLNKEQMEGQINFYLTNTEWETISSDKGIYLFKKKNYK